MAGAVPLSMSLNSSRLRLISSLGVGVLVGTSLIVIIPEGIGAASAPSTGSHIHRSRSVLAARATGLGLGLDIRHDDIIPPTPRVHWRREDEDETVTPEPDQDQTGEHNHDPNPDDEDHDGHEGEGGEAAHDELPSFQIGLSMTLGFVLMLLIDRVPRHAAQRMQSAPQTHHISLDNLGGRATPPSSSSSSLSGGAGRRGSGDLLEAVVEDGLLGQLRAQRGSRSLATTLGLVIHAAADGIAMGASATSPDSKTGLVVFIAIMIHKAPAAFGLTSLLLRQGLSKRAARGHLVVFSLAAPVGALATWLLVTLAEAGSSVDDGGSSTYWTGLLLLFSGGTFL